LNKKPEEHDRELSRQHAKTPDRGQPSGHTPHDATHTHARERAREPAGVKNHAPTEKARPVDTDRGGA